MRHKEGGELVVLSQPQHFLVEKVPGHFVQRAKGLIHEQDLRPGGQRPRDRNPHAHAAAQLARMKVGHVGKAHQLQQRSGGLMPLRFGGLAF